MRDDATEIHRWVGTDISRVDDAGSGICAVTMANSFGQIRYDVSESVATITLDRPERMNAWTLQMQKELFEALNLAEHDDAVRAVVFTGAGDAFCAGADLIVGDGARAFRVTDSDEIPRDPGGILTLRLFEFPKPLIAAVNGPAVGVGVTMTLPMDVRLASDRARFGFVFTRLGAVPEACSTWFLPRVVGIAQAVEWCLSGRVFDSEEALAGGLVKRVLPAAELLPAARGLAAEFGARTAPVAVALTRRMLWGLLGANHPMHAHRAESRALYQRSNGRDIPEGIAAFLDKRIANFSELITDGVPKVLPAAPSFDGDEAVVQ
jgi:enoyl-CoA hydratase/carnithine racemase